jgi:hypothetical protein
MTAQDRSPRSLDLPAWLLAPLLVGSVLALGGGYWDDAWHTERGRDSFFIAPHIGIYSGIALAGGALTAWLLLSVRNRALRQVLGHRPLALALLGVGVTLASGPIDNAWHVAFGRDAVIWSAPHALGIIGTAALGVAILVEVGRSARPWAPLMRPVAGAFVLAALGFLVVEYETDVPQFDAIWYLPVLAFTSALGLALIRLATPDEFAATRAAAVHFAFIAAVSIFVVTLGFDAPRLPLLIIPALVLDLLVQRTSSPLLAVAYVAALFTAYVPTLNWLGEGVQLNFGDVLLGLPLAFVVVAVALGAVFGGRYPLAPSARALTTVLTIALLTVPAAPALAHDPGQGDDAGSLPLTAQTQGRKVSLEVSVPPGSCREFGTGEMVARRAGETIRAPLERSGCRYAATLRVADRGRWFVYAELGYRDKTVESWLPVKVDGDRTYVDDSRYAYFADENDSGAVELVAGALMYAVMVGVIVAMVTLVRGAGGQSLKRRVNPDPMM